MATHTSPGGAKTKQVWIAKKGFWTTHELHTDASGATAWRDIGRETTGPIPDNNAIIIAYMAYLKAAIEQSGGEVDQINEHKFNLKLFVREELGNHATTIKVKAVLKQFQARIGKTLRVLPVGKRGQPVRDDIWRATAVAEKEYKDLFSPAKKDTYKKKK